MNRLLIGLAFGTLLLAGCASGPETETVRRDDAYVPIGSNIPRKDRKPEERSASTQMPPVQYIPAPGLPRN